MQVDTGEVENNKNEDYEKRGGSVSVVTFIVDTILDRMFKDTEQDMRKHWVAPNKETYQCLISRNCQDGDIEGASKVLQLMKNQGIKINEDMFNSLILGHGEAGDLLKVMKQWGLSPSLETFLNLILACGYSKAEDWKFVKKEMAKEMAEDEDQVYSANDYMELMLMLMLSLCRHKEDTAQLLALSIPEIYNKTATDLVVRLISIGCEDIAYNLVQYIMDKEGSPKVHEEFLRKIVR